VEDAAAALPDNPNNGHAATAFCIFLLAAGLRLCRTRHVRRDENAGRMDHAMMWMVMPGLRGQVDPCLPIDVAGNDDCHDATFVLADAGAV